MRGVSLWFFGLAVVSALCGMVWGIQMSASHNHSLSPAHAHLNLIGWAGFAIIGIYYHLIPSAAESIMAKVHFAVAAVGLVLIVPGIVQALRQTGETLAKAGSILTLLGMVIFALTVWRNRG
ncbi:hypothetical protein [Shimia aestuarii]|uniref:hypothetical protein n=1 Tax=Shimia aestuarii TaxID=254406 RepID=UPI001FB3C985|nr:hypothetical protein [Shimia aestuarii]